MSRVGRPVGPGVCVVCSTTLPRYDFKPEPRSVWSPPAQSAPKNPGVSTGPTCPYARTRRQEEVDFELPARKACAVRHEGCFGGLKQGSQLLRPGENIFVQAAWSSGDSGNFDFGQGFARLARVHGKKGDNYGDYRPDVGHDP